jgi:hypothetical protein
LAAKTHAVFNGKYSPDIEDVQAVAVGIYVINYQKLQSRR